MSSHASHAHEHGHGHGHKHDHGNGHGHKDDAWNGEEYLNRPEVKTVGVFSKDKVLYALHQAGLTDDQLKTMNLLEVGSGAGAVTINLEPYFASIHAIDTSLSMLKTFSTHATPASNRISHSLHALSSTSAQTFLNLSPQLSPTADEPDRKLPPPRSRFDVAIANLVMHHVDDLEGFLQGLSGVLVDGGWVVITEFGMVEGGPDIAGQVRLDKAKKLADNSVNAPGHYHAAFTQQSLSALLASHGFVDIKTEMKDNLPVWKDQPTPPCLLLWAKKGMQSKV